MRIAHEIHLSFDEKIQLIAECNAHNAAELKAYLKKKFNMQTDFCVYVEEKHCFKILSIDYDNQATFETA